jgi:tetratricopeptide (TPR) repeat protein
MKLEHYREAVGALQKLLSMEPRNANGYFLLGQGEQKLGDMAAATAAWKQAADLDPQQTEAIYKLSRAVAGTNPELAKTYRDRFSEMQKQKQLLGQAETLANFAVASANRGDYSQAIEQMREAIGQCGDCKARPDMYKDLGLIECKSGDVAAGKRDLLTAQSLKPADADVAKTLQLISSLYPQR